MFQIFLAKLGKCGSETDGGLNLDDWIDPRELAKARPFIQLGLVAACQVRLGLAAHAAPTKPHR